MFAWSIQKIANLIRREWLGGIWQKTTHMVVKVNVLYRWQQIGGFNKRCDAHFRELNLAVAVKTLSTPAPDLNVGGPGPRHGGGPICWSDIESFGRGSPMKPLVFPRIINICDVILWRHILKLKCNKTLWCNMRIDYDQQFVKLLQNRSPEASYFLVLKFCLKEVSGRSNVFIISKHQSSLSTKFYDRNQTLQ